VLHSLSGSFFVVKRNLRCLDGVEVADEELLVEVVKDEVDERSRFS